MANSLSITDRSAIARLNALCRSILGGHEIFATLHQKLDDPYKAWAELEKFTQVTKQDLPFDRWFGMILNIYPTLTDVENQYHELYNEGRTPADALAFMY